MTQQHQSPDHVTPYDRFAWSDIEVERLLVTGEHERDLAAYFGEAEYRELVELARAAGSVTPPVDAPTVFIIPGIMGSQLGLQRERPLPDDVLWLDPIDIQLGRLSQLHLSSGARIVPLGVVLYSHLRLKLRLRAAGFAPVLYDYDWRQAIDRLGGQLADRIRSDPARRVMLVGHSMGGLVSRAALAAPGMDKIERVVLVGTPNSGSFAPLQALRGTYPVVRKLARMDATETAELLASRVFNTFPSLYHMLPRKQHGDDVDLFDPREWPRSGPRPDATLLRRARGIAAKLAAADDRVSAIIGVGQETVTAVTKRRGDFIYTITRKGDGTVPAARAVLTGARNYYTLAAHNDQTRDAAVAAAVSDILRTGATQQLPSRIRRMSSAQAQISDRQLRRMHLGKVDWARLQPEERREFLENLNEPPRLRLRVARRSP